jgi:bacterial/archaeal transporter family protein
MEIWMLYALGAAVFAALVGIFGKLGMSGIDSTLGTAVRALVMAAFLVSAAVGLGKWKLVGTLDTKALLWIALSGIAGALSWLCYFYALKYGKASSVAAIDKTSVALVLIFAVLFLGEALTWKNGLGAALMVCGAILMILK